MKPTRMTSIVVLILFAFLLVAFHSVAAQTSSPAAQTSNPPAQTSNTPAQASNPAPTAATPKVIGLTGNLEADDLIVVEVEHLDKWATTNDARKLVPFLNGLELRGNYPAEIHASMNHLHFHLQILPPNRHVWVDLLGAPPGIRKPVSFSVGPEGQSPFDTVLTQDNPVTLTIISPWYGLIAVIVVVVTLAFLIWASKTTSLIREPGPKSPGGKLRPYNLGRTQMAFWFFLIYSSYVVIWLITDALDTITPSLLGLMGISSGTALSEALIDSGKETVRTGQLQDLNAEKDTLEQTIPELEAQVAAVNDKATMTPDDMANRDSLAKQLQDYRTRLVQISQQIQALTPPASANVSAGFLRDILGDSSGYSFHRFQIFAWTIVLGVIFVSSVYNQLTMPEFSATLLGLMGISSGTYLGFKFPEEK
ncbi:MAG TPA: hypothetical protein VNS63_08205 [Blastocatellia bacterium]|nr:hypothetical protein [Blastocatellia bacterium]